MVTIVMAVYNGEKYLEEQLESIRLQTYRAWKLLIRDDGSTDNTEKIIKKFAEQLAAEKAEGEALEVQTVQYLKSGMQDKKGAKYNFLSLLEMAEDSYVMCCDQDDVWKLDKIEKTLQKMEQAEQKNGIIPILVHSDVEVVDEKKNQISASFFESAGLKKRITLPELLIQNYVTGCTMMLNAPALSYMKQLSQKQKDDCLMHDYWAALVAQTFGKVVFLDETTMYYRQHENNSVGAKSTKSPAYLWKRLRAGKGDYQRKMQQSRRQIKSFCECYEDALQDKKQQFLLLKQYGNLGEKGKISRLQFYRKNHVWKNGMIRKLMQIIWG